MNGSDISFAVVATPTRSGTEWTRRVGELEQQGWGAVLLPDTLWTPSPFPTLAAAAAVTSRLRLRTWVLAAPTRAPAVVVRESSALQLLSAGRFELGIGTGRPDAQHEALALGATWGTAAERLQLLERTVDAVREQVRPAPVVAIAGSGPRTLAVAGRIADRIGLALPPTAGPDQLNAAVDGVRAAAAGRQVRLTMSLVGLAGRVPERMRQAGMDADTLAAQHAVGVLRGDPDEMIGTLEQWHEELGIDEFVVPDELASDAEPLLRQLV
jgi:alkanesulfonate monooxygenase SsuD/methylene tetrahydromethanopterin reductase-like flavin-dependent oxidoreductase (luciferase family)